MRKKIIIITLCFFALISFSFLMSSCGNGECVHQWGEWSILSNSTCINQGTKQRKCYDCEEIQTDLIDIAEHNYDTDNIVWAWDGYDTATATIKCVNDTSHTRIIEANISQETASVATCTESGTEKYIAQIKINGHTYSNTKK